jgi:ribonuclease HI
MTPTTIPTIMPTTTTMAIPTTFISNLEHLAKQYPQYTTPMETIRPHIRPPWWMPKVDIYIEPNRDAAKEYHNATISGHDTHVTACIYTDGSGIDGNIGAAAVCPATGTTHHQYLGKETSYNVYVAELCAIQLATEIIKNNHQYTKCILYTDNQAAITVKPGQQSGQSIIPSILDAIEEVQQRPGFTMSIVWTPGHEDIPGNEQADSEAKKAAQSNGTLTAPFKHLTMKSARNMAIHKSIKATWEKEWPEGKNGGQHLRAITRRPTGDSGPKLYSNIANLSRQELAWLARPRTGHCSLNKYLHRFNIEEQPQCPCGNGVETVSHYLLRCMDHDEWRERLRKEVGVDGMYVEKLLGHPKLIKHTLNFVKNTGRFTF